MVAPLWRPVCDLLFEFSPARCGHQQPPPCCPLYPKGGVNFIVCARFDPSLKVVAAQTEHPLSLCLCLIVVVDVVAHLVALLLCSFVLVCHFSRRCVAAIFNLLQLYGRASASATASNKFFFICLWLPFLYHHSLPSSLTVKLSPVRNAFINKVKSLP